MSKFTKLIPALAVAVALSPLAGFAAQHGAAQKAAYVAITAISTQVAANSKGRPAEFNPAQMAANSKGRPGEFAPANEVAANSKGRPAEFAPAQLAANSKGRPGEFQVADNSKGRPGEFSAPQYETPLG